MPPSRSVKLAVIGCGLMGSALARAFAAAGHDVAVWNRTPARARAVGGGTVAMENLVEAVSGRELVVVSLTNYAASFEVLAAKGVASALAGKTLVQLTSGTPADARSGLEWARANGVDYLDAAILAFPGFVATDYATVYYAGSRAVFDRHLETLQAIAKNSVYVDEKIGAAATLDCAILEAFYGGSLAFLHAAAMCKAEGLDPKTFFAQKNSFLGLISVTADAAQGMIENNDFSGDQCSLNIHVAAIEHIVRLSKDARISARFPQELLENYKRAVSAGLGDKELPAVFQTLTRE
ncbi:NAD(P)-dependent oxidoreductase [Pyxidicoccus fallax]|uniref:NAD(P)-dependent oxidoreductase n=1 Tax=Pyxidicoccus fallax TaxID=394095 RepID=A0A848LAB9_9BACT|nr:NAD(P)-binding domain-containing protein [Pyxidicoccus fallax]NMO15202.1 NAD(P)-dependent oxidoreductase [Pyxidicoccus fallax]NPC76901.1 NAD(P)-dependent oxidoreductase [Pyxidicoccus fallax]